MFDLLELVNKEQLLNLALKTMVATNNQDETAESIAIWYVLNYFESKHKPLDEDEVAEKVSALLTEYTLTELTKKGMIEANVNEDGDFVYSVTDKGKKAIED